MTKTGHRLSNLANGQVIIHGDAMIEGMAMYGFGMYGWKSEIVIDGNLIYKPLYEQTIYTGCITVKGDIETNKNLKCTNSNKFVLAGVDSQKLDLEPGAGFSTLIIENTSEENHICL